MRSRSIDLTDGNPNGRENSQRVQSKFGESTLDECHRDLVRVDLRVEMHKHMLSQRLAGIKRLGRSCRRWQLFILQLDLRGFLPLGMPLRFHDPRRSQCAPG